MPTATFTFNGRIDVVATLHGTPFLLRGEASVTADAPKLRMSYAAPSFNQAVPVGTLAEIIAELGALGATLPGPGGVAVAPNLDGLVTAVFNLPRLGEIAKQGLAGEAAKNALKAATVRITELVLEVTAPDASTPNTLPPGTFTVGLGLDLRTMNAIDRTMLGVTLESIVLTLILAVG